VYVRGDETMPMISHTHKHFWAQGILQHGCLPLAHGEIGPLLAIFELYDNLLAALVGVTGRKSALGEVCCNVIGSGLRLPSYNAFLGDNLG
jgi:hypothetical protein